ncbi:MAG: hypothetical protein EU529_07435 [Promethearchaeota archaeon]|nr:MAG: hypothetical protein EU529_07435 [Candidatus Lokiarchaeota archaeon]
MPEINKDLYFKKISPKEININKEDIFYRDKYNEIINYIKVILTDSENLEFTKYLKPKGTLLINIQPGTDIIDFLKLISSNYYLDFIELINTDFITQNDNFKKFVNILENIEKYDVIEPNDKELNKNDVRKQIILINQPYNYDFNGSLKFESLMQRFINHFKNNINKINFIEKDFILIWLNYDYKEIYRFSSDIFEIFDLFIKIPVLNRFERETVLRNFSEKNTKIVFDINAILNSTENWEVKDIKQLLKIAIFKHHLNSDLNTVSNEITDTIIDLIETGEFIPSTVINDRVTMIKDNTEDIIQDTTVQSTEVKEKDVKNLLDKDAIINGIREMGLSEFMLNQLYENAASKNYNELLIIIDKLQKNEVLEDNERKILARYPFILNDTPNIASLNLEKAKKRVDLLKNAFGK